MPVKQMELRLPATATALSPAARVPAATARVTRTSGSSDRRARRCGRGRAGCAHTPGLSAAALERLEESLLADLLDVHANGGRALDRLLDDVNHAGGAPVGSSLACRRAQALSATHSPASQLRIEELLVAAVIGGHPRRRESLDRLLDDLAETRAELRAREAFDAACDNDCDGLG
jgi:hypothetical protein